MQQENQSIKANPSGQSKLKKPTKIVKGRPGTATKKQTRFQEEPKKVLTNSSAVFAKERQASQEENGETPQKVPVAANTSEASTEVEQRRR